MGAAGTTIPGAALAGQDAAPEPTVTFEDQQSDGSSVVVAEVATDADTTLHVADESRNLLATVRLEAGDRVTDLVVDLTDPLSESQELRAFIIDTSVGDVDDTASISLGEEPGDSVGVESTLIDANPDAGFNYPYLLRAPSRFVDDDPIPPLVEPANSGTTSDDIDEHLHAGRHLLEGGFGWRVAEQLGAPFVVPVFPRPREQPVDWTHYVHALDDTTVAIDDGPLERVDLQLLNMVDDARRRLSEMGYPIGDGLLLNGFSASGNFVDRFAVLHPEEVTSVTAGGLNGMPLLPIEEFEGTELPYHVGIADVERLTGDPVDLEALDDVDQFLYMGAEDTNDTIPYDDAWTDDDLRQLALDVYGDHMIEERFPRSQEAYQQAGVDATFRIYEDAGHTPRPAEEDVVEFHRRSIVGESVTELGQEIRTVLRFDRSPEEAAVGDEVEFDASASSSGSSEITHFLWDFGTGDTAVGERVTYTYDSQGEHAVTLTAILESGSERETTETITVAPEEGGDSETDDGATDQGESADASTEGGDGDETDTEDGDSVDAGAETDESPSGDPETEDGGSADGSPGFGVTSVLVGLGGTAYALKRRLDIENRE